MDSCNPTSAGLQLMEKSEFSQCINALSDILNSKQSIDFVDGKTDAPICLIGTYLGTQFQHGNTNEPLI